MGSAEVDRKINAAFAACRAALAAVTSLRGQRERIEAAADLHGHLRAYSEEAAHIRAEEVIRIWEADRPSYGQLGKRAGVSKSLAAQIIGRHLKDQAQPPAPVAAPAAGPQPETEMPMTDPAAPIRPPIVAAIITSAKGVLITRRHDGSPLWGFVTGEVEPGESAQDAVIREAKEEATLEVVVSHMIGERLHHPATGRHVIYLAARPYHGTEVGIGDQDELAEVVWVDLPTALDRLKRLYEPVRDHLTMTLGNGSQS